MLYREAARILQDAEDKKRSTKNLILSSKFKNKKLLYAIVFETLKYKKVLRQIIEGAGLQKRENALKDANLALVLVYDLLFGKGISDKGPLKDVVLRNKAALNAELARLKLKANVTKNEDLLDDTVKDGEALPRYVRVNTLQTTMEEVISHFKKEDYIELPNQSVEYSRYLELVRDMKAKQFTRDPHVTNLLVFSAGTDLHDHVLYTRGDIIFQDKASCLPAFVLNPPPGSSAIDCCAAPGNKTTHLAAILGNKGKIYAFDKDAKRLGTMGTLTLKAGVLCAELQHQDFLKVQSSDPKYSKVEYILVDPSCSGSGIVSRLNTATDNEESMSSKRLESLANFQTLILKHALSFPSAKRVVYSTCSVHHAENEAVVATVLKEMGGLYTLERILEDLPHRGECKDVPGLSEEEADKMVRTSPGNDLTNGFFVALFKRNEEVERAHDAKSNGTPDPTNANGDLKPNKKKKKDRKDKQEKPQISQRTQEESVRKINQKTNAKRKREDTENSTEVRPSSKKEKTVVTVKETAKSSGVLKNKKKKKKIKHRPVTL